MDAIIELLSNTNIEKIKNGYPDFYISGLEEYCTKLPSKSLFPPLMS